MKPKLMRAGLGYPLAKGPKRLISNGKLGRRPAKADLWPKTQRGRLLRLALTKAIKKVKL